MHTRLDHLFKNNRAWSKALTDHEPGYFRKLSLQQAPEYLWIGCSDSRVPANEITGLLPGELFVHRNVANLVYASDLNCLSVIEFAVNTLHVKHIIVCGHYGCGGIKAAMQQQSHGLIDNWLNGIRDTYERNRQELLSIAGEETRMNRLCELSVLAQVWQVARTTVVQEAWAQGQKLTVHGWIYGLTDGLIQDLGLRVDKLSQVDPLFRVLNPAD